MRQLLALGIFLLPLTAFRTNYMSTWTRNLEYGLVLFISGKFTNWFSGNPVITRKSGNKIGYPKKSSSKIGKKIANFLKNQVMTFFLLISYFLSDLQLLSLIQISNLYPLASSRGMINPYPEIRYPNFG